MPTPSSADAPAAGALPAGRAGGVVAVLRLARWPNALIAASGVLLGAAWAGTIRPAAWLAALAAVALTTLANTVNDVHDVAIDAVAHPERPLPSGAISRDAARVVAGAAAVAGVAASAAASPALGVLSLLVAMAMLWYSLSLKSRHGLSGNLLVALLASLPFLYGAVTAGRAGRGLVLVGLAMPLHFAREVAKDLDDAAADATRRRTLPLVAGARAARLTVVAATALFALLATGYFARHGAAPLALALTASACAAVAVARLLSARRGVPALLKGSMLLAMGAVAADSVLRRQ